MNGRQSRSSMTGSSVTSSGGPKVVPSPWQSTTKNERINRKDNQTHSNTSNDDSFTTLSRVTPAAGYPGPLIRVTPTPRKLRIDPDNDQNLHKGLDDDDVIRPVLPPLDRTLRRQLRTPTSLLTSSSSPTFAVNEECTSLQFSPSGRLLVAGFTDGTVRLFDLTGRYPTVWTESGKGMSTSNVSRGLVDSNHFQKHGAVACQIHAKGVVRVYAYTCLCMCMPPSLLLTIVVAYPVYRLPPTAAHVLVNGRGCFPRRSLVFCRSPPGQYGTTRRAPRRTGSLLRCPVSTHATTTTGYPSSSQHH